MQGIKKLKDKFFAKPDENQSGSGLYATLEELMEQRQYVAYVRQYNSKISTSQQAGDIKSAFKGRGIELEEIRGYTFGDDVRDIDWRVTARKLNPYTKLYAQERDREVYVLLDLSPQMVFGTKNELKSVSASKITSLLGWLSLESKDRFGCIIFDGHHNFIFKPQNNRAGFMAVLKKISEVSKSILKQQLVKTKNIGNSLQLLQKSIKSNAIVFLVSDFNNFSDDLHKSVATLSKKSRVYCINVFDVLEEIAPKAGEYMVEDGSERLVFETNSNFYQKEYKDYFAKKHKEFKDFCNKFGIKYVEVRTDILLYKQLKI